VGWLPLWNRVVAIVSCDDMKGRQDLVTRPLTDDDFATLLAFRDGLRRFLRWSEQQAQAAGLTPAQHQLLLAIRGHGGNPSVGDVADHLLLRHHSVVELVDRAEENGLVSRRPDPADQRIVRLAVTSAGTAKLTVLAAAHIEEISRLRGEFTALWQAEP
jgi:DNA-binding MarR family transcriptional regulator